MLRNESIVIDPLNLTVKTRGLLALLLQQHPEISFFDSAGMQTGNAPKYSVETPLTDPLDDSKFIICKQEVMLSHHIVRYIRSKKPEECRYAVYNRKELSSGFDGKVFKVEGTIKFVGADKHHIDLIYKPKDKSGKMRKVKRMVTLPKPNNDKRTQNEKAQLEYDKCVAIDEKSGVKKPILTADNSTAALIMRFHEGKELFNPLIKDIEGYWCKKKSSRQNYKFTDIERLQLAIDVGEAIMKIHANGVIHRDIKPENIIINRRSKDKPIVVIDFTLAKFKNEKVDIESLGSPNYMSPEAIDNETTDEKSDAYAYAVILGFLFQRIMSYHSAGKYKSYSIEQKNRIQKVINLGKEIDPSQRASIPMIVAELKAILEEVKAKPATTIQAAQTPAYADHQTAYDHGYDYDYHDDGARRDHFRNSY